MKKSKIKKKLFKIIDIIEKGTVIAGGNKMSYSAKQFNQIYDGIRKIYDSINEKEKF